MASGSGGGGGGPFAGGSGDKHSEVARLEVWRETIAKEIRSQRLRTDFSINPSTIATVTEKPHQTHWSRRFNVIEAGAAPRPEGEDDILAKARANVADAATQRLLDSLQRRRMLPNEKSDHPLTGGQDYGFDIEPLVPRRLGGKWDRGHHMSDVSRYVDAYYVAMQRSPFSAPPGSTAAGAAAARRNAKPT